MIKSVPKLSPSYIKKGRKNIGVILSLQEFREIQELLEDLEDIMDFNKVEKERFTSFETFVKELNSH